MVKSSERQVSARLCASHRSRVTTLAQAVAVSYNSDRVLVHACITVIIKNAYSIKFLNYIIKTFTVTREQFDAQRRALTCLSLDFTISHSKLFYIFLHFVKK